MPTKSFSVIIEGDYIDSFIYSGNLILVDTKYELTIYRWNELFNNLTITNDPLCSVFLRVLMHNSNERIPKNSPKTFEISKKKLKPFKTDSFNIDVWPTDISVYSNKLYIASENGLTRHSLEYKSGKIDQKIDLYKKICFSVSPNSFNRLAFAAGTEGVFTFIPKSQFYNDGDKQLLIEEICLDVDWQNNKLFANTPTGFIEAEYQPMPDKKDFKNDKEFFEAINKVKSIPPTIKHNLVIGQSWSAGDKTYRLTEDEVFIDCPNTPDKKSTSLKINFYERVIRARTAAFGIALETENELSCFIGNEKIILATEPVNWRVFPRATNYANQIHVVHDNFIEIKIIESPNINNFGFDPSKIENQPL